MGTDATYNPDGGEINNIESLIAVTRSLSEVGRPGGIYFRGQANASWGLRPSIGRCDIPFGGKLLGRYTSDQEKNLLHRFRRHTYSHLNRALNEWEALFLARHHSLPVRILDWSSNSLVALYGACWETPHLGKDGTVWALRRVISEDHDIDLFRTSTSPLAIKGVNILYPFYGSPRITAQSGLFTIQEDPWTDLESYFPHQLPDANFDIAELVRMTVLADAKPRCIEDLERLGINHGSIFPDLDGFARGLWQTEVLPKGG